MKGAPTALRKRGDHSSGLFTNGVGLQRQMRADRETQLSNQKWDGLDAGRRAARRDYCPREFERWFDEQ